MNGAGYLIPYGRTCTFVPGWKGLVDLVSRSGRGTVFTGVIFKDQRYTFTDGARRDLIIHEESDLDAPEDITHAYAIGWVKDSSMPIIELWSVEKIKKHRDKYNKVGSKHYSYRDWEMYCRKVPLLQVLKYMPASVELSNAIGISNASEVGRGATIENGIVVDAGGQFGHNAEEVDTSTGEIKTLPACSDADFEKKARGWRKQIVEAKTPVAEVLATIKTKYTLTEDQERTIDAWGHEND